MKVYYSLKWFLMSFFLIVILVAILFWLYLNVVASMQVSAQQADIQLSHSLPTKIHVGNFLEAQAIGILDTQIDVNENLELPLTGKYLANLTFSVEVPVEVSVDYKTEVIIDQIMPLSATTDLVYQKKWLPKFPLNIDIPVKLKVPFHLKETYRVPIKINFNGPVDLAFNEKVNLNVVHQFKPRLNLKDPITLQKIATFKATMYNSERDTKANLDMKMTLPIKNIHP